MSSSGNKRPGGPIIHPGRNVVRPNSEATTVTRQGQSYPASAAAAAAAPPFHPPYHNVPLYPPTYPPPTGYSPHAPQTVQLPSATPPAPPASSTSSSAALPTYPPLYLPKLFGEEELSSFRDQGFVNLGQVFTSELIEKARQRADGLLNGTAYGGDLSHEVYQTTTYQADAVTGLARDTAKPSRGFKGASTVYRKVSGLEADAVFFQMAALPLAAEVCRHIYEPGYGVQLYDLSLNVKPKANPETVENGVAEACGQCRWSTLSTDPLVCIITALDDMGQGADGCLQIALGSHKLGIINPSHQRSMLSQKQDRQARRDMMWTPLTLAAGESALVHNWLVRYSKTNTTATQRRYLSASYMLAGTLHRGKPSTCRRIFGPGASTADDCPGRWTQE